jgi:hypothetical protein
MKPVSLDLGANQTSNVWECVSGGMNVHIRGTFSAQTVTLKVSATSKDGTYTDYAVKNAAGTLTTQTFTAEETVCYLAAGQFFKASVSNGGSPVIDVFVEPMNSDSVVQIYS